MDRDRLKGLAALFAIDVCGFSIKDNHLHVLLKLDLARTKTWSPVEVVRRWLQLCPLRDRHGKPVTVTAAWIAERAKDSARVEERRIRLSDLGWYMKSLKKPFAKRANREDACTGAFWQERYKSIGILDETGLLATCAYIDLNPVAAGLVPNREKSNHTSIKSRPDYCATQGKLETLLGGSSYASCSNLEKGHWLFPIEDRRDPNGNGAAGMLRGISLTGYLQLLGWSSRQLRPGKLTVSDDVPDLLTRLQIDAGSWKSTLEKLLGTKKKIGSYFGDTARLNEVAVQRGTKFLKNVAGRETQLATPSAS
ncbi:MAG: hypothetical protein JWM11_6462 [Planctomycetaceae bacterium]|nr:hypothetical protein [Planctomycetaceae bacterium]